MNAMPHRNVVMALTLFAALVVAGAIAWLRWPVDGYDRDLIRTARSNLALLSNDAPVASLAEPSVVDRMETVLIDQITPDDASLLDARFGGAEAAEEVARAGVALALRTLSARAAGTVDEYIEWMEERAGRPAAYPGAFPFEGSSSASGQGIETVLKYVYGIATGETIEQLPDPHVYVRTMLERERTFRGGVTWLRRAVLDADACHIAFDVAGRRGHGFEYRHFEDDPLGANFWYGCSGENGYCFWPEDATLEDVIERDGEALVMRVSVVGVGEKGLRVPTLIYLYYDPAELRWRIRGKSRSNLTMHTVRYVY
ncbi:MAG: hypothetical protein EA379_01555 [Phycisphaerales bacterium]|nr:MAG: hypothetical protein EA379_01555 [Phycisphaerales bacterium]